MLFGKPPECKGGKEVYNDYNGNLANLFYCVKNRTLAFLKELGFLPLNSRDEFNVLRRFFEKGEFDTEYLKEELELAQHNLSPPEFVEMESILLERAEPSNVWRAAAFFKLIRYSYGSSCTSYGCQSFDIRKAFHIISPIWLSHPERCALHQRGRGRRGTADLCRLPRRAVLSADC